MALAWAPAAVARVAVLVRVAAVAPVPVAMVAVGPVPAAMGGRGVFPVRERPADRAERQVRMVQWVRVVPEGWRPLLGAA